MGVALTGRFLAGAWRLSVGSVRICQLAKPAKTTFQEMPTFSFYMHPPIRTGPAIC